MNNETEFEIQIRVALYFNPRINLAVPNVAWGMFGDRECDLVILSKAGYASEVEIKVSKSDLKRDAKKWHNHNSQRLRNLWFAIPEKLRDCMDLIPVRAGILIVRQQPLPHSFGYVEEVRKPITNTAARKLSEKERFQLARLGALRIWSLQDRVHSLNSDLREARKKLLVFENARSS